MTDYPELYELNKDLFHKKLEENFLDLKHTPLENIDELKHLVIRILVLENNFSLAPFDYARKYYRVKSKALTENTPEYNLFENLEDQLNRIQAFANRLELIKYTSTIVWCWAPMCPHKWHRGLWKTIFNAYEGIIINGLSYFPGESKDCQCYSGIHLDENTYARENNDIYYGKSKSSNNNDRIGCLAWGALIFFLLFIWGLIKK